MNKKPILLIIMDGFGLSDKKIGNAVFSAKTPNLDKIFKNFPSTVLNASGLEVGLPKDQMGNSEVGHMNIGAGRIIFQDLSFIDKCIENGDFYKNEKLIEIMDFLKEKNSTLHLIGLLSDGAIHSSIKHLFALMNMVSKHKIKKVFIHVITDGRDTCPKSALNYISKLEETIKKLKIGEIKTISGRFYAMDRDKNLDRTILAFDAISKAKGNQFENIKDYINTSYNSNITDEFIIPALKKGYKGIEKDDVCICYNFRSDRARQISNMFLNYTKNKYFGFTKYSEDINCIFEKREIKNTLGEYISNLGLKQLRVAETEKYAHVTFFLNGGKEEKYKNEDRILINSPKVKTYDLAPEMSAKEITNNVVKYIKLKRYDVIFVNYANADMVGHTGNFAATVKAVETIDKYVGKLSEIMNSLGGITIITADHGNAEKMVDENKNIFTAHTTNLVPFCVQGWNGNLKNIGNLSDIAPTILDILNIEKPAEMTGNSLILKD